MYGGPVESVLLGVETVSELNSENLQGGDACCRRTKHGPLFYWSAPTSETPSRRPKARAVVFEASAPSPSPQGPSVFPEPPSPPPESGSANVEAAAASESPSPAWAPTSMPGQAGGADPGAFSSKYVFAYDPLRPARLPMAIDAWGDRRRCAGKQ